MKTFCMLIALAALIATTYSQTTTPAPTPADWFTCPARDGYFAHPYDCVKYFVCVQNNAWLLRCPPSPEGELWFDAEKKYCNYPQLVACTANPTGKSF
ncbi:major mite allergen Der p 23-like [Neocloeon triangulifer]|uniref:major mite allergen Der p 23-like n=1 Tax=Neocloeon triangulifer TaxID=2078957 RepID=UPI00286F1618|nr:major mite allergen Der p 23-like [Neocloeon triangulifer]